MNVWTIYFMAFFALSSDITIGSFRFQGVNEVRVKRSLHSYADTAFIKMPSRCKIQKGKRAKPVWLTTADQIKDGAAVTINLGYYDPSQPLGEGATPILPIGGDKGRCTVFQGFVKRRDMNMPLEIECEGYVRQMRLKMSEDRFYPKTSAKELLGLIHERCPDITIKMADGDNIPMLNMTLTGASGADICDKIKELSQGVLSVFFINPTTLWCGMTYTPYVNNTDPFDLGTVNYRLGYNVVKDNNLKERVVEGEPVQVILNGTFATGAKISTASQTKYQGRKAVSFASNIGDVPSLQKIANEKQYQMNYAGYEGAINAFFQPICGPGWKANIVDDRYPERNGVYMIEGTDISFGQRAVRVKVEIGPKIGFNPNF